MTLPSFTRIEVRMTDKADIAVASTRLRSLANRLARLACDDDKTTDEALILAHHAMREASAELRAPLDAPDL